MNTSLCLTSDISKKDVVILRDLAKRVLEISALPEQAENLRLVAVSPWSNREIAAEKIGKNYVYVYKPNPSYICLVNPDWDAAEKQIRDTIKIAKGCPMHIVMKDTHTFCNEPNRITKWAEIASRIVLEG